MSTKSSGIITSLLTLVAACLIGCGSDPADVAGSYTIAVTNADNGCNFTDWTVGDTTEGIRVSITQDGASATAVVEGITGTFLTLALGSNQYNGDVDGNSLYLTLYGTTTATEGNCTFTYNSIIDAGISGDVLTGDIRYEAATVGNPDCAAIEGCVTLQHFNGTRPPSL